MSPVPPPGISDWRFPSLRILAASGALVLGLLPILGAPGDVSWRRERPGSMWETPVVGQGGRVYAVRVPQSASPALLEAFTAEGAERWSLELAARDHLPPVLDPDGNVVVVRTNGTVRSLSPDGETLWTGTLRLSGATGLALDGVGHFHMAGTGSSGEGLYAVLHPDGRILARGLFAEPETTTPVAAPGCPPQIGSDGTVIYQGTGGGVVTPGNKGVISNTLAFFLPKATGRPALGPADILVVPETDGLSIRSADGQETARWSGAGAASSPIITPSGQICFGTVSNRLEAVNFAGNELWSVDAGAVIQSTPVCLQNGTIVAATLAGRLFAVNSQGVLLWERALDGPVTADLNVLPDGRVVTSDNTGTLWCVETGSPLADTGWPKWQSDPANGGRSRSPRVALAAPSEVRITDEGALRISWNSVPGARTYEVWKDTHPEFDTAILLRPSVVGQTSDSAIPPGVPVYYRIRAVGPDGAGPFSAVTEVTPQKLLWSRSLGTLLLGLARLKDGTLVASTIKENQGQLIALAADGSERWRRLLPRLPQQGPVVAEDGSIWIPTAGTLRQFQSDGSPGLTVLTGAITGNRDLGAMALGQEGTLYVVSHSIGGARLLAVHPTTGQIRGSSSANAGDSDPAPLIVGSDGSVLALHERILACHEPGTQLRWTLPTQPSAAAVLGSGDYMVGTPRGLMRITPAGKVLWTNTAVRTDWAYFGRPSMIADQNDVTYAWSVGRLFAVSPTGETLYSTTRISLDLAPPPTFLPRQGGVYVLGGNGIFEIDASGSAIRRGTPPALGSILDGFAVSSDLGGTLYLGSFQGSVAALDLGVGVDTAAPWPLPHHDDFNSSGAAKPVTQAPQALSSEASPWVGGNRISWRPTGALVTHEIYRAADSDFSKAIRIGTASATDDHFDDAGATPGLEYHYWVLASNPVGTSPPGEPTTAAGQAPTVRARLKISGLDSGPTPSPVVRPDQTIVAGTGSGLWVALDLDGSILWTNQVPPKTASQVLQSVAAPDGRMLFQANTGLFEITTNGSAINRLGPAGSMLLLGPDGRLRTREGTGLQLRNVDGTAVGARVPQGGFDGLGAIRSDGVLYVGNLAGKIRALDNSLNLVWEYGTSPEVPGTTGLPSLAAVGLDGSVYVAPGNRTLVSLDPAGNARWTRALEPTIWNLAPPVLGAGDATLLVSSTQGNFTRRLSSLDARTGDELWHFEWMPTGNRLPASSPAVLADHTVLYAAGNFLWALDSGTGQARWGFESEGIVGAPILSEDGSIIFTAGDELVVLRGTSPQAFSGWPMARHDAHGTGGQGTGGPRTLAVSPRAGGGIHLDSPEGAPFLPLVSTDLLHWGPADGVFEADPIPGKEPKIRFVPALSEGPRFFRALAP